MKHLGVILFALCSVMNVFAADDNPWNDKNPGNRQKLINEMQAKMANDNFLKNFIANSRAPARLSSGVSVSRPFAFDDGYSVTIIGFADYAKVTSKFASEGMIPNRVTIDGKDKAMVFIDVTSYQRTSAGPAYVARIFSPILLSKGTVDYIESSIDSAYRGKVQYAANLFFWKYWEGGGTDIQVGGREVLHWPQDPAILNISYESTVKSAVVSKPNGQRIFSMAFNSKNRLNNAQRVMNTGLAIAATPGNKEFNPSAEKAVYGVVPIQGVAYENPIPFDPQLDSFQAFGSLKTELDAIEFDLKKGFWKIQPFYQGVFLPDPPPVKKDM